uniref:Uncharacterized protein n=1 Tax=Globodera pallida TaxID=36090 RepID=A0A183CRB9_GLOPA
MSKVFEHRNNIALCHIWEMIQNAFGPWSSSGTKQSLFVNN